MGGVYDGYESALASRNASEAMQRLWSARHKFNTWRRIWLAVAEAQHEAGLGVTREQVEELRGVVGRPGGITDEEIRRAAGYEREVRHDVMAHVRALGDACPRARGIIHLGMTSQDVVCNADLNIVFESLRLVEVKLARVVCDLGDGALRHAREAALGFTHYQPAQPVTVGRRMAQWAHDVELARERVGMTRGSLRLRGLRGATGTQASFAALLGSGLESGPNRFEQAAMSRFWADPMLDRAYELTGQTYPRVVDAFVLGDLAAAAAVLHKIGTDIRLLSNRKEVDEPFEEKQIGSSAMPYKRNPMRCERMCGLSRFVMNLAGNAYDTAAVQWLERTLDDSSNRRLSLPEAFLALDGALELMHDVGRGLIVHGAMVRRNLEAELPFLATEEILMACVGLGGDRQEYHERIRVHAQAAGQRVKEGGGENDLLDRLKGDKAFWGRARGGLLSGELEWTNLLDPMRYVGRSVEQTERFVAEVVGPVREEYGEAIAALGDGGPVV